MIENKIERHLKDIERSKDAMDGILINDFIAPFCEKHKLSFYSGMGSFYIENHNGNSVKTNSYDIEDFNTTFYKELKILINDIEEINDHTKFLGCGYEYTYKG